MKKKVLITLISFCTMLFAFSIVNVSAATIVSQGVFGYDNNLTWSLDSNGTLTIDGSGEMPDYNTPWSSYKDQIKKVTIGSNVETITSKAFYGYANLTTITIPDSIKKIGEDAFYATGYYKNSYNWNNQVLYLGKYLINTKPEIKTCNIMSGTKLIADSAFYERNNLTSITIPNTVTSIGDYAFGYCLNLTSITIPEGINTVGIGAFYNCRGLTQITWNATNADSTYCRSIFSNAGVNGNGISVTFGDKVEKIPSYLFQVSSGTSNTPKITSVTWGKNVKTIGECAFYACMDLTELNFNNSIETIGTNAFTFCENLKSVKMSDSVKTIGKDAFSFSGITSLEIGNGLETINDHAFYSCQNLTSVSLGNSVKTIGAYAFYSCEALTNLAIPNSVTYIGECAFRYCENLTDISLGTGIKKIDTGAFWSCYALDKVNITDLTAWCKIEFMDVDSTPLCQAKKLYLNGSLITNLTIPSTITCIGDYSFYNCSSIKTISLHSNVTSISNSAFRGCSNVTDIIVDKNNQNFTSTDGILFDKNKTKLIIYPACKTNTDYSIPNGVSCIKNNAFSNCTALNSITIPSSVKTIEVSAFSACSGLTSVNITDIESWCNINFQSYNSNPLNYAKNLYLNGSLVTNLTIPDSIINIENYAFYNCVSLTEITIPNSVVNIGESSFSGCASLASITIPNNVETIGQNAFYKCVNLTEITIPNSVVNIGESSFSGCTSLVSITIPKNVETIGKNAFYNCTKLSEIVWNAKKIPDFTSGNYVFYKAGHNGDGINVIFGDGVERIPSYAFYPSSSSNDNPKITNINIGKNVTSIGTYAFGNNQYITEIIIPDSVTNISNYAFYYCTKLENIKLGAGLKIIGSNSFSYCKGVKNLNIPEGVTKIDSWAFSSCSNLKEITLPSSLTNIGNYAFYSDNNLTSVLYNGNETNWAKITIGSNNTPLTNATKNYFWYVTYVDENGEKIHKDTVTNNETVIFPELTAPENCFAEFYADDERKTLFNVENPVTENTTLFVSYKLSLLNNIEIAESVTTQPGATKVAQTVRFATDKEDSVALVVELKIPEYIILNSISPIDFEIAESDYYTQDHYTYLTIIGQYTNNGDIIPANEIITPFEVLFDVSKTAETDDAKIEFTDNTYLMGSDSYTFDKKTNSKFTIEAKLMEKIEIVGDDSITVPTKYEVIVIPDYTTNTSVTWSVDDETIATVSADGLLTPLKGGTVTLTATANDGSGVSASKQITIVTRAVISTLVSNIGTWDKDFDPYVNDYIVYVGEDETVIKLTSNFASGTLRVNNSLTVKNFAKPVDIKNNITKITLSLTGGTDLLDNTYTVTVIKGNDALVGVAETSENGYSFEVFLNQNSISDFETATLIVSIYGDNGRLIKLSQTPITTTDGIVPIGIETTEVAKKAKLMLWKDFETLVPLCESTEITLE